MDSQGARTTDDGAAGLTTARLEAFSDGVIAIAVTLLVLELKRPADGETVWHALWAERAVLVGFAVSFGTIGIFWVNHHALFRQVRRVDRPLLFLNLLALGTITFLPYPTGALGSDSFGSGPVARAGAVLYAISFGVAAGSFTLIRTYLHFRPDLLEPAARGHSRHGLRGSLVGPVGYGLSALLALAVPVAGLTCCAAIGVYFIVWTGRPPAAARTPS